ncbi:hypothetical protein [Chitiniphilus eburneus]|uniref:Uncharacterized protein n=1 Tax=Chitiniphilus eburneus TaxID=2571148 RepID=A0A4U0PFH3_9NEIS|nr:hypothetical protein [Chitiniphilus eburneus]TJZ65812.1 hypothetical protein FAZ21_17865 [Chitiniphilus eburneus]
MSDESRRACAPASVLLVPIALETTLGGLIGLPAITNHFDLQRFADEFIKKFVDATQQNEVFHEWLMNAAIVSVGLVRHKHSVFERQVFPYKRWAIHFRA